MSQHNDLSIPNPELAALLAKLGPPAPLTDDVLKLRDQFNMLIPLYMDHCETRLPPASAYRVMECKVPVDGGEIAVRCLTPTPSRFPPQAFPLLVWYHSGGWTAGTLDLDDYYLRSICVELGLVIANVDYRLAPEHPFPTGVHDAYAALKWAATHASELSADPARGFLAGGTSAGANLAAAVAIRARDDAFFARMPLTGQVLQMPCVVHPDAYPEQYKSELSSMERHADAPFLTAHKLRTFAVSVNSPPPPPRFDRATDATQAPPADPLFSPLLAPSHARLPRTYVQVCGLDPLRDEGLLYARVLREAGVTTKLDVYPGVAHSFNLLFPEIEAGVKLDRDFRAGIRWLLHGAA